MFRWTTLTSHSSIIDHFSGERVLRSRQHDRGTSQERRYKRSHRRSPSSGRQHGHRDRDRDRLAHPTSSRRARIYRHHVSSSTSQDRHRHRSPSSRSQVSLNGADNRREFVVAFCSVHLISSFDIDTVWPHTTRVWRITWNIHANNAKSFSRFCHESITCSRDFTYPNPVFLKYHA